MPTEKSGVGEFASVQITPAVPNPDESAPALAAPAPTPKEKPDA